jgi:hypothetical protein
MTYLGSRLTENYSSEGAEQAVEIELRTGAGREEF